MAVNRTYGALSFHKESNSWRLSDVEPHVCIKLKNIFQSIPKSAIAPFDLSCTEEISHDLHWFFQRYRFRGAVEDFKRLGRLKKSFEKRTDEIDSIVKGEYVTVKPELKGGEKAREYQLIAANVFHKAKRMLLGDEVGLGKTCSAILSMMTGGKLPALVVVQTHLTKQWKDEITRFSNLETHIIKGTIPYSLPVADVYIIKYGCLSGWVNVLSSFTQLSTVIFDEVQELRREDSQKYKSAQNIASKVEYCLGMSATPVYNFGDEIFNVMNLIKPLCFGTRDEFLREWGGGSRRQNILVKNPAALGTYMRERNMFLRRTLSDVQRELPPINKIVHTVGYNEEEVERCEELARELSIKVINGETFHERGQAARELDIMVRQTTGISKAKEVAAYVRILLENNEPVVLAGWHREVYKIWERELAEFNPVFFTGTESEKEKNESKRKFISGETNLFIISLRSGIGLDGLQHRCRVVVVGELDWSPQIHHQVIGRVNRDGQLFQVTVMFLVSEYGSDPLIIDLLGIKSSQSHGILNPLEGAPEVYSDDSRIKLLAQSFLEKHKAA